MFSVEQKRTIADGVQELLRDTQHPELPSGEIEFHLHVEGAKDWSWADIKNNGAVPEPTVNPWNEEQAKGKNDHMPVPDPVHKTIYIVTSGDGSDGDEWDVEGLFSTREKADLFINGDSSGRWSIEEWKLDEREDESVKTVWVCRMDVETGTIRDEWCYNIVCEKHYTEATVNGAYAWSYSSVSQEHAHKLAAEKRQEILRRIDDEN